MVKSTLKSGGVITSNTGLTSGGKESATITTVPFGAKWTIPALIRDPHSPFTHSGGTPQKTGVPPLLYIAANRFCP